MRTIQATGALLCVMSFAACGATDSAADEGRPAANEPTIAGEVRSDGLAGRSFESVAVHGFTLVAGTRVRLWFESGALTAVAGCNQMTFDYELREGVLTARPAGATEIACQPDLDGQDRWIIELLSSGPKVRASLGRIDVVGADGALVLADTTSADTTSDASPSAPDSPAQSSE